MREVEAIRKHPLYVEYYDRLKESEKERKFCCHQMEHLLDVARIAYICNLEKNMGIQYVLYRWGISALSFAVVPMLAIQAILQVLRLFQKVA